jgi:hypothetical protein
MSRKYTLYDPHQITVKTFNEENESVRVTIVNPEHLPKDKEIVKEIVTKVEYKELPIWIRICLVMQFISILILSLKK